MQTMIRMPRLLAGFLCMATVTLGQTQSFNVSSWYFGKNVTSELPAGVIDVTDNLWSSSSQTCPILIGGTRAATLAQLACRKDGVGTKFSTVVVEGDPRLVGTKLAISAVASAST